VMHGVFVTPEIVWRTMAMGETADSFARESMAQVDIRSRSDTVLIQKFCGASKIRSKRPGRGAFTTYKATSEAFGAGRAGECATTRFITARGSGGL